MHRRQTSFQRGQWHLIIQEGVVEADLGGLVAGVGVDEAVEPCPVDGGEAHRAGFATGVDGRPLQAEIGETGAGAADGDDFGMGGRVAGCRDLVTAFADDDPVFHHHRAERAAGAAVHPLSGEFDGTGEETVVVVGGHTRVRERIGQEGLPSVTALMAARICSGVAGACRGTG